MKRARSYKFVKKSARRQKKTKKQQRNKLMKGGAGECTLKNCLVPSIPNLNGGVTKILISELIDDPNQKTIDKTQITQIGHFTASGATDPFATTPYDRQKLIKDYYILHIDKKYYFIHRATYDPQKTHPTIVKPEARTYKVYILQDLMDDINDQHRTNLTVGGAGNGNDAKVLVSLSITKDNTKFDYGGQTLPLLLKDRTIIDIDGTEGVKYEDSLLMAHVDVPGTPYTELPKTIIYKLLVDPAKYAYKKITAVPGFTVPLAANNIFHPSPYDADKLVAKCHILHVFGKHFFIPKVQYAAAVAGAIANPLTLVFNVYVLQDLVNATAPHAPINIGGNPGKVICELKETNGHFDFGANPFPVLGRKQRDIIDLDGGDGVKYEDSLLSTQADTNNAPAGAIPTKLAKTLIHKIIESTNVAYNNLKITTHGPLDAAAVLPNTNMYANQKLIDNYHVLHVFAKYFFISKEEYNNEKAKLPNDPANWNYDAYLIQEARNPAAHGTRLQINQNGVNILCILETIDSDTKFTFDGEPFPLGGRNSRRIIDLDGREYMEYNNSQFAEAVSAHAAPRTVRRSPSRRHSPRSRLAVNYFTMDTINQYVLADIDNYSHQNPNNQIRSELHRTYVDPRGSPFKPNIYDKISFYTVADRLFCSFKGKEDEWGLNEVKKYTITTAVPNFDTYLITTVNPDTTDKRGNPKYLLNPTTAPNANSISIVDAADYVVKTTSTNILGNVEFLQWIDNGTDSTIKRQLDAYAAAAPVPP